MARVVGPPLLCELRLYFFSNIGETFVWIGNIIFSINCKITIYVRPSIFHYFIPPQKDCSNKSPAPGALVVAVVVPKKENSVSIADLKMEMV
jgi:hypothetical protein